MTSFILQTTQPRNKNSVKVYNRAQVSLNDLQVSMEKYLTLVTLTYREEDYPPVAGTEGGTVQVSIDKQGRMGQ